ALVAQRPFLARRQALDEARHGGVDLALVWVAAEDQAERHAVRAEEDVHAARIGQPAQRVLYRAAWRVEILVVVRVAIHFGERQRSRDRLSQIGEGRLGS